MSLVALACCLVPSLGGSAAPKFRIPRRFHGPREGEALVPVEQFDVVLLVGAGVLLFAIVGVRLSTRTGLPSLLLYLAVGLLIGEDGLGIYFDDEAMAQVLGLGALVLILAEGGLTTNWRYVRPAIPVASVLATVGVGVSVLVTAVAAYALLDVSWQVAVLVGAIVSSTDAAAVFSVLRTLRLDRRPAAILEAESGFNDAPVLILVIALSEPPDQVPGVLPLLGLLVVELVGGAAIGLGIGWLGAQALRRVALPASGLYPLAVLALSVGSYAGATLLHLSGFLAVYLTSLVLGNSRLPHGPTTRSFAEGVAWLAQIGLFVMLGLLATPRELGGNVLPALGVGLVLLLVARPLSVVVSSVWFRIPWHEQAFLSWAGLRGAVPIVVATIPVTAGVVGSERIFNLVFVLVIVFTLVQGPTLPWVARRLDLVREVALDVGIESAPLAHLRADLLEVSVPPESRLHGVEIFELRLPAGASVTLVVRDGQSFVPDNRTVLRAGDELLIVATEQVRDRVERRLRAVSRRGKLAGWRTD
jgi:cell volume regulation protein A